MESEGAGLRSAVAGPVEADQADSVGLGVLLGELHIEPGTG